MRKHLLSRYEALKSTSNTANVYVCTCAYMYACVYVYIHIKVKHHLYNRILCVNKKMTHTIMWMDLMNIYKVDTNHESRLICDCVTLDSGGNVHWTSLGSSTWRVNFFHAWTIHLEDLYCLLNIEIECCVRFRGTQMDGNAVKWAPACITREFLESFCIEKEWVIQSHWYNGALKIFSRQGLQEKEEKS